LQHAHWYAWYISACNGQQCSSFSGPWTFLTVHLPPAAPQQQAPASGTGEQSLTTYLSWYQPAGATAGFTTYRARLYDQNSGAYMGDTPFTTNLWTQIPASMGLQPGRWYSWSVFGCNGVGGDECSGLSPTTWDFWTAYAAPAAPQPSWPANNQGELPTPPNLTLQWLTPAGAIANYTTYSAEMWDVATSAFLGYTPNTTGLSVQVPTSLNLQRGRWYSWAVFACNGPNCSGLGTSWWFWTEYAPPATPQKAGPASGASGVGTTPVLSWSAPAGAVANYTTYAVAIVDTDTRTFGWGSPLTTGMAIQVPASAGLVYGRSYNWNLYACNGWACSSWGPTEWTFTTAPVPGAPARIAPADGSSNTGTAPVLSWSQPANALPGTTTYSVFLLDTDTRTFGWGSGATTALSVQVQPSAGLLYGRSYNWNLYACTDQACSA